MRKFVKTKVFFSSLFIASVILGYAGNDANAAANPAPSDKAKQSEKVYKSVGPNGEVIYSDQPSRGSEEITLPTDKGYQPAPVPNFSPYQPPSAPRKRVIRNSITITSPSDGQTIRNATGNVQVSVSLASRLRGSQRLEYVMDGKTLYTGRQTSHRFSNIFRGIHVLTVRINDNSGSIKSSPVTFYMHRPIAKHITPPIKPKK